jgi:hypothetical protein
MSQWHDWIDWIGGYPYEFATPAQLATWLARWLKPGLHVCLPLMRRCQGLIVALITGVPLLGLAEWVLHWLIDWGKCQKRYNLGFDQALHLACKALWITVLLKLA